MRYLKLITGTGFAVCALLLVTWPMTVGSIPPKGSTAAEYRRYQNRSGWILGGITLTFFVSAIGSALIVKQAKDEFRRQSSENLKNLIEGATEDIRRKHEAADQ
jgi:hypothetical protein